jgi:hypothetical protein
MMPGSMDPYLHSQEKLNYKKRYRYSRRNGALSGYTLVAEEMSKTSKVILRIK